MNTLEMSLPRKAWDRPTRSGLLANFGLFILNAAAQWALNGNAAPTAARLNSIFIAPMALWFCCAGLIIVSALGWIPFR